MKNDVLSLPPNMRAIFAHELIISLDENIDANVSHAWKNEINKRVSEIKSGIAKGRPAEQVLVGIRTKYS
ncbi:addiction module protein [candidate division KSB1 bacterium]|nr:addiction module protein [candidate division KSB1 bacterium]MBL7095889.1 addiction module protein [candidate division KSB1 bacterium]